MIWPIRTFAVAFAAAALLVAAPLAQAQFVSDSFTGTDGTLLENHVGEVGAAWTYHANYGADIKLQTGRVWGPEWGLYYAGGVPPTSEYDVSASLLVKSNSGALGLVGRGSPTGTDTFYMGRYNASSARWELVKCTPTCTVLGFYAQTLTIGSTYAVKLEIRNAAKKLYVDGVERASSTDNTITQVGRAGIRSGPGLASTTTGYHLDNFTAAAPPSTETSITAGPTGATSNASPSFSFNSTPAGGTFECKLDGPGATTGTWGACTNPKAYSSLAQGSYTFSVRATVGGVTDPTPATRAFTVDTTAPDTTISSGPSGATNNASPSFGFSSSEPTGATYECRLDTPSGTGTFAACTSPKAYSSLAAGSYTVHVRARDAAGNQDGSAATRSFSVDTTAPDTSITSGPTGTITTSSASFGFSSNEPTGATFECKLDGPGATTGTYASCTSPKAYSGLANGSYTFSVRASDAAGNQDGSAATRTFTVSVAGGATQCSDGVDNDSDGQTDYPADVHCLSAADDKEAATSYTVKFQDSFEGATFPQVFQTNAWVNATYIDGSGYAAQVTPSGYSASNGTKVFESHVGTTGSRAEIQCHRDIALTGGCAGGDGAELYYEFDVRIPSGQTLRFTDPSILQTKPTTPTGGGNSCYGGGFLAAQIADTSKYQLKLHVRGGIPTNTSSSCTVPTDEVIDFGSYTRDAWHHVLLHVKWSTDPAVGFVEAEVDGVAVQPKEFMQTFLGQGRYMMFRPGAYVAAQYANTFQYDNVKIGIP